MKTFLNLWPSVVLLGLAVGVSGCKSPPAAGAGSVAWVEITNRAPQQILLVTKAVFLEKGYKLAERLGADLIFEKAGNFTASLLHGSLDSGVVVRVFVSLDKQTSGTWLLHCHADAVRDANKHILEESERLSRFHSRTFEPLLVEIKHRLEAP